MTSNCFEPSHQFEEPNLILFLREYLEPFSKNIFNNVLVLVTSLNFLPCGKMERPRAITAGLGKSSLLNQGSKMPAELCNKCINGSISKKHSVLP